MDEILKSIRVDLRRSMNGDVSKNMRDKGLDYKINFGIDVIRLRTLAKRHEPNAELAQLMWDQQPRELKMMASMLYPAQEFTIEKAEEWIRQIPTHEIREQLCMNLLQNLSFADILVSNWLSSDDEEIQISGLWLVSRIILSKSDVVSKLDLNFIIDKAITNLRSENYFMRMAAQNALKFMGRISTDTASLILNKLDSYKNSADAVDYEIYNSLSFEFDL